MVTLDEINKVHEALGSDPTLSGYLGALRAIGIVRYASYVRDGHSEYYCTDGQTLISGATHETFAVADQSNPELFSQTMTLTEQGTIDYTEMSRRLAASGVEQWVFDTTEMTVAYIDKAGNALVKESVQNASV